MILSLDFRFEVVRVGAYLRKVGLPSNYLISLFLAQLMYTSRFLRSCARFLKVGGWKALPYLLQQWPRLWAWYRVGVLPEHVLLYTVQKLPCPTERYWTTADSVLCWLTILGKDAAYLELISSEPYSSTLTHSFPAFYKLEDKRVLTNLFRDHKRVKTCLVYGSLYCGASDVSELPRKDLFVRSTHPRHAQARAHTKLIYDESQDCWRAHGATRVLRTTRDVVRHFQVETYAPFVEFQELLENHPSIASFLGSATALVSVRINTFMAESGSVVTSTALARIPQSIDAIMDDWNHGALCVSVHVKDGKLSEMGVSKFGRQSVLRNGQFFAGFQLPCWCSAIQIARDAHEALWSIPKLNGILRRMSFDVALTPRGAILLEMSSWSHPMLQLLTGPELSDQSAKSNRVRPGLYELKEIEYMLWKFYPCR